MTSTNLSNAAGGQICGAYPERKSDYEGVAPPDGYEVVPKGTRVVDRTGWVVFQLLTREFMPCVRDLATPGKPIGSNFAALLDDGAYFRPKYYHDKKGQCWRVDADGDHAWWSTEPGTDDTNVQPFSPWSMSASANPVGEHGKPSRYGEKGGARFRRYSKVTCPPPNVAMPVGYEVVPPGTTKIDRAGWRVWTSHMAWELVESTSPGLVVGYEFKASEIHANINIGFYCRPKDSAREESEKLYENNGDNGFMTAKDPCSAQVPNGHERVPPGTRFVDRPGWKFWSIAMATWRPITVGVGFEYPGDKPAAGRIDRGYYCRPILIPATAVIGKTLAESADEVVTRTSTDIVLKLRFGPTEHTVTLRATPKNLVTVNPPIPRPKKKDGTLPYPHSISSCDWPLTASLFDEAHVRPFILDRVGVEFSLATSARLHEKKEKERTSFGPGTLGEWDVNL